MARKNVHVSKSRRRTTGTRVSGVESRGDGSGRISYVAVLGCGCTPVYPTPAPRVGDEVHCRTHGATRVDHVDTEHRARCQTCSYSRSYGRAGFAADRAARDHAQSKGHTVDVWEGSRKTFTHTYACGTIELPSEDDSPPF